MTNQASIQYISSLLDNPAQISGGDHNSVALFRQTYPYFVPARYILAGEKHKKNPFGQQMLSEIQPYMGNWMMLCSFLDASTKEVLVQKQAAANDLVTSKKSTGKQAAENENKQSSGKVPSFMQGSAGANQPKPVGSIAGNNTGKGTADAKPVEPIKPVVPETNVAVPSAVEPVTAPEASMSFLDKIKAEGTRVANEAKEKLSPVASEVASNIVPPVTEEAKKELPPVAAEVQLPEVKAAAEELKHVVNEIKKEDIAFAAGAVEEKLPPVVAEIKEELKQVIENVQTPLPPVVSEVKNEVAEQVTDKIKEELPSVITAVETEEVKQVTEDVKSALPPVVIEAKSEAAEQINNTEKDELQPVISEVKLPEPIDIKSAWPSAVSDAPADVTLPPVVSEVTESLPPVVSEVKPAEGKTVLPRIVMEVTNDVAKAEELQAPAAGEAQENTVRSAQETVSAQPVATMAEESVLKEDARAEAAKVFEELKAKFPPIEGEAKREPSAKQLPVSAAASPVAVNIPEESPVQKHSDTGGADETAVFTTQKPVLPTKLIPVKVALVTAADEENEGVVAAGTAAEQAVTPKKEQDDLILPVYTEDYFLQQGMKVSEEIPEEIGELVDSADDDEDRSLMVMMSFTEWLLHFKNTTDKHQEEKKDQKALKTMWQKEKLAAAMEEENEEIPENVFEMAVNSITKEDGLASESLADIYIKQGKYDKAIEMYRKLSLRNPKKNAYFARRIEEVLKEKQS